MESAKPKAQRSWMFILGPGPITEENKVFGFNEIHEAQGLEVQDKTCERGVWRGFKEAFLILGAGREKNIEEGSEHPNSNREKGSGGTGASSQLFVFPRGCSGWSVSILRASPEKTGQGHPAVIMSPLTLRGCSGWGVSVLRASPEKAGQGHPAVIRESSYPALGCSG